MVVHVDDGDSAARIAKNRTRSGVIPGGNITDVPADVRSAPPPWRASAHAGSPAPAKAAIKIPRAAGVRQVAPVFARNPDVAEARRIHPVATAIRVPRGRGGDERRPDIALSGYVVPVAVGVK